MSVITIESIRHTVTRIRVVRRLRKYYWPFWKKDKLDKYRHWKRPVGEKSLKVVEAKTERDKDFEEIGFAAPGVGRYPNEINLLVIKLSNGKVLALADKSIPIVWLEATDFLHCMHNGTCDHADERAYNSFGYDRVTLPNGTIVNYEQALHLRRGQVVKRAEPLRLDLGRRRITDGDYSFPLARPFRSEWRYSGIRFAKGITADNWSLFLKAVIGLPVRDVIGKERVQNQVIGRMRMVRRREKDRERKRRIGQCFTGHKAVSSVSIGKNLIFTLQRDDVLAYVVDSPEYASALYVFDSYEDAHDWASRAIGWREARERARLFRVHRGNWKEEIDAVLA